MKFVLKIGGSILYDGDELNVDRIKKWLKVIKELLVDGHQIGIVIGGGKPARQFSRAAAELGATMDYQDFLGIESARQNARLFISGLSSAYPSPPKHYEELINAISSHDLVICGGFQPGQSTNAVASIFAENMKVDYLFNLSNVEKVYDKDPEVHKDAKAYDELSYDEFGIIISKLSQAPGGYALFDHLGLGVVKRSKIKLVFLNGENPENIGEFLNGNLRGTMVK